MKLVSVIIPARCEPLLQQTVDDVLGKACGDVEAIVVLDGYWPSPELRADPRLRVIHWSEPQGVRPAINAGASIARGYYLMKLDAHCALSPGYDTVLQDSCDDNCIVVPEKYSLLAETWERFRQPWQYFYLTFPWDPNINHPGLHDKNCGPEVNRANAHIQPTDEILTYQGSCWFLTAEHFKRIGPMDAEHYHVAQEPQELGLATWLTGGRCLINKACWYAHLFKGTGHKRQFSIPKKPWVAALRWSAEHWLAHPRFPELVERFWPLLQACEYGPWPTDWQHPKYRHHIEARERGEVA